MICSTYIYSGLGNILFKVAAAFNYAQVHGREFIFFDYLSLDAECTHRSFKFYKDSIFKNFNHSHSQLNSGFIFKEEAMLYKEVPKIDSNIIFWGDFQSEKYFQDSSEKFRNLINISSPFTTEEERCFVHVRRGDYLSNRNFYIIPELSYYQEAVSFFDKTTQFIILSDDIAWCKENITQKHLGVKNLSYSSSSSPEEDMAIMKNCNHGITANSTFSWWGAYFITDKNKKIITPKQWITQALADASCMGQREQYMNDLIPKTWTKV
jgi:hypothetical protein